MPRSEDGVGISPDTREIERNMAGVDRCVSDDLEEIVLPPPHNIQEITDRRDPEDPKDFDEIVLLPPLDVQETVNRRDFDDSDPTDFDAIDDLDEIEVVAPSPPISSASSKRGWDAAWLAICVTLMGLSGAIGYALGIEMNRKGARVVESDKPASPNPKPASVEQPSDSAKARAEDLVQLAHAFFLANDVDAAIAALEKALEENPNCALAHYGLGSVLLHSRLTPSLEKGAPRFPNAMYGEWTQCIYHLEKAIELNPIWPWPYKKMASVCEGLATYSKLPRFNSTDGVAFNYFTLSPQELSREAKRFREEARALYSLASKN